MAINSYSTLQTAIESWLKRADLDAQIPDFITICEDSLNKRLRIRGMEVRATSAVNTEYVELPTGFLEMRNFQLNTTPKQILRPVTPEYIDTFWAGSTTGRPKVFAIVGGEIQLAPSPDGSYTAEMDYYKKLDLATDLTNWVILNAPSVYLYGSLLAAEPFMKNDKRIPVWRDLFERAVMDVERADSRDRWGGGSLSMRTDFTSV